MKKVLVIGSSNVDFTTRCNTFPKPGETVMGSSFMMSLGGKGLNQAVAASLTGADVTFLTALGNDSNKDYILNELKKYKLKVKPVLKDSPTGVAIITVEEKSSENEIIVNGGANLKLSKEDIDKNINLIKESDYILLQLEIDLETLEYIVDLCYDNEKVIILNPAPYHELSENILSKVTYLTPNENELKALADNLSDDFLTNGKAVLRKRVRNLVVTLGKKGSCLINDEFMRINSFNVNSVDTTGAGDCYNGVFVGFLSQDIDERISLTNASYAAALSTTKVGASSSYPSKEEILNR